MNISHSNYSAEKRTYGKSTEALENLLIHLLQQEVFAESLWADSLAATHSKTVLWQNHQCGHYKNTVLLAANDFIL